MFRLIPLTAVLLVTVVPAPVQPAELKPLEVDRFWVVPGEPGLLRWKAAGQAPEAPLKFTLRDYQGRVVSSGEAKAAPGGVVQAAVKLAPGYYELELAGGQRYGVVSLPPGADRPDPFFCVDAAMSWLVRDLDLRGGLVRALRRGGIAMSRERLRWASVNPAAGRWEWETPLEYETLRRTYAAQRVEVLEMFHDAPAWQGLVGKYPGDLAAAARCWRRIGLRWQATWGGLDVWNEPDIFFGDNLPADQYVPLVKTIAWALARAGVETPLVGGVTAHHNRPFLDCAARNGMLDCVDAVSFHTYGRAPQMEELIGKYRAWLADSRRPSMPLWITECGRPWRRGPARPPADQDASSALDITMKAVEARAGGVARYFAFVYPFYEERDNNFGMMGREGTPLRSMAAYARLASLLAGKRYLGDLACEDRGVQRARVFGDENTAVAVIYTGQPGAQKTVRPGLPVVKLEGIDGRPLEPAADGALPVPDGLVYAWLDRAKLADRLQTDTEAMRLTKMAQGQAPRRPAPSPIVLQLQFDAKLVVAGSAGYRLRAAPEKLPFAVRVFNLSEQPRELVLEAATSRPEGRLLGPVRRKVNVPAEGAADVAWEMDVRGALAAGGHLGVKVTAVGKAAAGVLPLVVDLFVPAPPAEPSAKP